jgi:predicted Zn-dependent protease
MRKLIVLVTFVCSFSTFSQKKTNHDLSCFSSAIDPIGQLEEGLFQGFSSGVISVTLDDELDVGKAVYDEMLEKYTLRTSGADYVKINGIMNKLIGELSKFYNPTAHEHYGKYSNNYKIYIIESDEINAFTAGARIFITTGIYKFCKTDDEIACIIGHEMCHNELGHINRKLIRHKTAVSFLGEGFGDIAAAVGSILISPFNQKNEGHCDLFGIDLANSAGYDACKNVNLWERMNESNGEKSLVDLFSSHPYSGDRAKCSKEHMKRNYGKSCY